MLTNGLMSKQDVKRRLDSIFGEYSAFAVNPDDQKKFLQKSKLLENDFKSTTILLDVKQKHVDNQIQSSSNISSIIGQLVNISKPLSPVVFEQCDNKLINDSEGELKSEDKFTNKIERSENGLDIIFKQISCISPLLSPISTFSPLLNKISTPLDNNIKQEINSKIDEDKSKNKLKRPNSEEINSTLQETKRPKLAQNNENNNSFIYSIKLCKNSLKKLFNKFPSNCQNEQQKQEEEEKVNEEEKNKEEKEAKVNEEKQKEEEKELKEVEEKESLQTLLRKTYEIESAYLDKQRTDCLNEMREAMELVDKMRRKQSSIVNSLKLATGATSGTTDDIDIKIFNLKARMEKIKQGIEELVQRWMKIESICGFSITGPFGVAQSHESIPIMGIKQIERIRSNNLQQQPQNMHNNNNNNSNEYSSINSEHQHDNGPQFQFAYQQLSSTNPFVRPLSRQSASTSILSVDSSLPNKTKKNRFKQLFRRKSKIQ